jgi:surface protein
MEPRVYIAENGITIKCVGCKPGYRGIINGRRILVVDNDLLRSSVTEKGVAYVCTSLVTDMSNLFKDKWSFNFNDDITHWDTSNVTTMAGMFWSAFRFNQPIGKWDTGNVINMSCMFCDCGFFNQPLGNWNVKKVTTMAYMFNEAKSFNQPIGNWDVGNVQSMHAMFWEARSFNQPLHNWNIRSVSDMGFMFHSSGCLPKDILNHWNLSHLHEEQKKYMFKPETIEWENEKRRWKIAGLIFLIFWLFSFFMTLDK